MKKFSFKLKADANPDHLPPKLKYVFIVVLGLKVLSAIAAWYFKEPWSLGFLIPLAFMAAYIIYGGWATWSRSCKVKTVYGDSCYYLGFVFTIASIILAMADFSSTDLDIGAISTRFAAALVTTGLGMAVRVFCVTFGEERDPLAAALSDDAVQAAKPAIRPVDDSAPVSVILEVTAHNLSEFNRALGDTCASFSRTGASLLSFAGGLKKDLEIARAETQAAVKAANEALSEMKERCGQSLDQQLEATKSHGEKLLEENRRVMEGIAGTARESLQQGPEALSKAFTQAGGAVSDQAAKLAAQITASTEGLKQAGEKLSQAIEGSAAQLDSGEFPKALSQLSGKMASSADEACGSIGRSAEALAEAMAGVTKVLSEAKSVKAVGEAAGSLEALRRSFDELAAELKKPLYKKLF